MRQIETEETKYKRQKRSRVIISVVLGLLMIFSTAAYAFFSQDNIEEFSDNQVEYNGILFQQNNYGWQAEISGNSFIFRNLPNETSSINLSKKIQDYYNKPLYFIKQGAGEQEISYNLQNFVERIQLACLKGENCTGDWAEKNCSSNIIIFKNSPELKIEEQDNCVFIYGEELKQADAFLYKIFGIK